MEKIQRKGGGSRETEESRVASSQAKRCAFALPSAILPLAVLWGSRKSSSDSSQPGSATGALLVSKSMSTLLYYFG